MNIEILYEDNHILVVNKPINLPVQEDISRDKDLCTLLKEDLKKRYNKPGNVYLGLIHRLDRPVGGVMVFAKTSKAAARLSKAMQRNEIIRQYIAVVHGVPTTTKKRLVHYLWKDTTKNIVHAVNKNREGSKEAILDFEHLGTEKSLSLVAVQLHTGRSHQIRVQLATEGMPLFGDQKYGRHVNEVGQQLALWAQSISFSHPTTKEMLTFTSTPPTAEPWTRWLASDGALSNELLLQLT